MQNKVVSARIEPKKEIIRSVRYTPEEDALLDVKCAKQKQDCLRVCSSMTPPWATTLPSS